MAVGDTTTTGMHATPPTLTVAPLANPEPVMVSAVPSAAGPPVGLSEVFVGGGW